MKSIAFIDDHKLFTTVLSDFVISKFGDVRVRQYDNPRIFLGEYKLGLFDILIVDLEMPEMSGIEVIKNVQKRNPSQKIIVLSMFYNAQIAVELKKLGVLSFLPKNTDIGKLEKAIDSADKGLYYYERELDDQINTQNKDRILLSRRELEIIKHAALGHTSDETSHHLHISVETVKTHLKNIKVKTGISNLKEIITRYQKEGWEVLT